MAHFITSTDDEESADHLTTYQGWKLVAVTASVDGEPTYHLTKRVPMWAQAYDRANDLLSWVRTSAKSYRTRRQQVVVTRDGRRVNERKALEEVADKLPPVLRLQLAQMSVGDEDEEDPLGVLADEEEDE